MRYNSGKYVKFALQVSGESVTLFYNCQKHGTVHAKQVTEALMFDLASTLYIGQAGPIIKGNLDVSKFSCYIYRIRWVLFEIFMSIWNSVTGRNVK